MTMVGLMLIVVGFFGFLGGCLIYSGTEQWTNIYGQPTTLSTITFNTLMGISGGMIGAYAKTRDPFWVMSGALCGIISVAAGMDTYYPGLAFALAFLGGVVGPMAAKMFEKWGIDDAVGAVSVHGVCGILGVLAVGIFLSGHPTFSDTTPAVTFMGQLKGTIVMMLIGFVPGFSLAWIFNKLGVLRASDGVQEVGMDVEVEGTAYPEDMKSTG